MAQWVKATNTDEWLPRHWRLCTFPILKIPAKTSNDISGAAFLLEYQGIQYIITAKHVIEDNNYAFAFCKKNRKIISVKDSAVEKIGAYWVNHPADNIDLAAIPFIIPDYLGKELDLLLIEEQYWNVSNIALHVEDEVAHLGYPERVTLRYTDGSPSVFPVGMPGRIIAFNKHMIVMQTAGAHGASGGPVFLRSKGNTPVLIGVVIRTKIFGKITRPHDGKYRNETHALPISLVKGILKSAEMKEELENIKSHGVQF